MQYQTQVLCSSRPILSIQSFQEALDKIIKALISNSQRKVKFGQQIIQSQIKSMFQFINPHPTISSKHIEHIIGNSQTVVRMLMQNKNQMSLKDFEEYIGVDNDLRIGVTKIQMKHQFQLLDLISNDKNIFEQIKKLFSTEGIKNPEALFENIDNEKDGFINSQKIISYIEKRMMRHHKNNSDYVQKNRQNLKARKSSESAPMNSNQTKFKIVRWIIKFLKNSSAAQKIFLRDFLKILDYNSCANIVSIQQQNQHFHSPRFGSPKKLSDSIQLIGKITRVTHLPYSHTPNYQNIYRKTNNCQNEEDIDQCLLSSSSMERTQQNLCLARVQTFERQQQNRVDIKQCDIQKQTSYSDRLRLSSQVMGKIGKQKINQPNFEDQLSLNHPRNRRIIQKLKINYSLRNTNKTYHDQFINQTKLKCEQFNLKKSEIIYQLRYLAQLFYQHHTLVKTLITNNAKFTFVNAFNVIDWKENRRITEKDLLDFIKEAQIIIYDKKIRIFYNLITPEYQKGFDYSTFINSIFKLKSTGATIKQCRKRRPFYGQKWPQPQKKAYCHFLRQIITLFCQRASSINSFIKILQSQQKQNEQLDSVLESFDLDLFSLKQIIGPTSQYLMNQIQNEYDTHLNSKNLFSFLANLTKYQLN